MNDVIANILVDDALRDTTAVENILLQQVVAAPWA